MFLLTELSDWITAQIITFIILVPFAFAFVYFSIKYFKYKKVKDTILGVIGILSAITCIIGLAIIFIYASYGGYYDFKYAQVLNMDNDKIHVRYKRDFYDTEYTYHTFDRPFYMLNLKENDFVYVRLHNGSDPKLFLFGIKDEFGAVVYDVGFIVGAAIVIYYFVEKEKLKKEERKKMGYEEES